MEPPPPRVLCVMGPTAVGKSDLAVDLALRLGGEVVNADSMQVFRYLPIGTAAPTPAQQAAVPHHLFSWLDPDRAPDAGDWARRAAAVLEDLHARGRLPVVVGGTFFWMRALFDGLSEIPPVPADARASVARDLARDGLAALHDRLREVDPALGARLPAGDTQRIVRALEVYEATGVPLSEWQARPPIPAVRADVLRLKPTLPREALYRRIDRRVDRMFAEGLVDEVRRVLDRGFPPDCRPLRTASYAPVVDHVLGRLGPEEARDRVARGHRNYAKRQATWLRREPGVEIDMAADRDRAFTEAGRFAGGGA